MSKFLCAIILVLLFDKIGLSQVIINEIMVNPSGANDGANTPNTSEWVELYNAGGASVDLSCWVLADGDMTITIPSGNSIAPGGYYTIASNIGSGLSPNLDFGTCACGTPAAQLVIFTNGGEQLVLSNSTGQ